MWDPKHTKFYQMSKIGHVRAVGGRSAGGRRRSAAVGGRSAAVGGRSAGGRRAVGGGRRAVGGRSAAVGGRHTSDRIELFYVGGCRNGIDSAITSQCWHCFCRL